MTEVNYSKLNLQTWPGIMLGQQVKAKESEQKGRQVRWSQWWRWVNLILSSVKTNMV